MHTHVKEYCEDHIHVSDPDCEACNKELAAYTKSDPEIEARVKLALDYFWTSAAGTIEHHLTRPIPADVAVRLEAAAYDAIEAWRAENPPTVAPFGWEPAPQWAKDAKDQDSR